jgi:hypothetical protein
MGLPRSRASRQLGTVACQHRLRPGSLRQILLDAGDALKQVKRFFEGWVFHRTEDLLVERLHLALQDLQMSEGMADQEALVIGESMAAMDAAICGIFILGRLCTSSATAA